MSDIISGAALGPAGPNRKESARLLEPTIRKGATDCETLDRKTERICKSDFSDYLRVSYDRCRSLRHCSVRTNLSLDWTYIHLHLKCKDDIIEDDDLIANR